MSTFGTVAIYGVGLIGGSIGMALRTKSASTTIIGIGRDTSRLKTARDSGAIDAFTTDVAAGVSTADLIILCTPVSRIIQDLPWVLANTHATGIVTDAGSVKGAIVEAAGHSRRFVGSHPMAGSEQTGVEAARPDLFEHATWIITPSDRTDPHATEVVSLLAATVGADLLELTPDVHDQAVAMTSHLPHVLASALIRLATREARNTTDLTRLSAGSFADATRVAAASPEIWRDICVANRGPISSALRLFARELTNIADTIDNGGEDAIERFFAETSIQKKEWRRSRVE